MSGILLLNKAEGLTSNAALQQVKWLFNYKKAGHTGSLDPLATGMLPVCFGEATKLCQYLLDADKVYLATGLLGIKTTTGDSTGVMLAKVNDFVIETHQLQAVLDQFLGLINQIPPMFSALKHQGKPLYKLAREGITIERQARPVTIHSLDLLHFVDKQFVIKVRCSKGTYIRSLIEDIGEQLGVYAHLTQLHRLHTANFINERMYSIDELKNMNLSDRQRCCLPLEKAIDYLPNLVLTGEEINNLRHGKKIVKQRNNVLPSLVRLHDQSAHFIGIGEFNHDSVLKVKRLMAH